MNWYKKAQMYSSMDDVSDDLNDEYLGILEEYYNKKRKKGQMMSWDVVPFARLKKIWEDFARTGIVRDTNGLDEIIQKMIKTLSKIQAATDLAGHSQFDTREMAREMGVRHPVPKNIDFYFNFLETQYGTPISDYGLKKLWAIAEKLMREKSYEKKLLLVDQMLNVVHQRGDLAALFIEGGSSSLSQLSALPENYNVPEQ